MIGLDTSFLVGLAIREHPSHQPCMSLFRDEIVGGTATMALAPQVLTEFCHVVTDPRRFEEPIDMPTALRMCEQWWNAQECRHALPDSEGTTRFLAWMSDFDLGRKRLLDTLLAATYHRAGVQRIATGDWRDFSRYGVFDVVPV